MTARRQQESVPIPLFPPKAAFGLHWNWIQAAVLTAAHNDGIAGWSAVAYNVLGSEGAREGSNYLSTVYTREVKWRLVPSPSNQQFRYCWLLNLLSKTVIYFCHASSDFLCGKSVGYYVVLFSRYLSRFSLRSLGRLYAIYQHCIRYSRYWMVNFATWRNSVN